MKEIPLTQDKYALIDDEDYERVIQHTWRAKLNHKVWYAYGNFYATHGKEDISLHVFLLDPDVNEVVDHRDGNGLNCIRSNLRITDHRGNAINSDKPQGEFGSGYRGVTSSRNGKWQARISNGTKRIALGTYDTSVDAARAYDEAARELHGEFAVLNFPQEIA